MTPPNKHYKELYALLASVQDPKEMKNLLTDILTPQELDAVTERLQILKALNAGTPQREIAQKLNVSISTITRGSRVLKYGTKTINKLIENL